MHCRYSGRFGKVHKCTENATGLRLAAKIISTRSPKEKVPLCDTKLLEPSRWIVAKKMYYKLFFHFEVGRKIWFELSVNIFLKQ